MDKKKTVKKTILIIVGVALMLFGAHAYQLSKDGLGDVSYYCGELKYEAELDHGAYDEEFDVYIESPLLIRKVEMYQFVGNSEDPRLDYSDQPETVTGDTGAYKNPSFPEFPKSENFYGLLSVAGQKVYLSGDYLDKLSYKSYVDFEEEGVVYPVSGIADYGEIFGLHPANDYALVSVDAEEPKIGDIRVSWYTIDPADLDGDYTVIGVMNGNVLEKTKNGVFFYDRKISEEEIRSSYETGNRYVGIALMVVGFLCVILPIILGKKNKKKSMSDESEL